MSSNEDECNCDQALALKVKVSGLEYKVNRLEREVLFQKGMVESYRKSTVTISINLNKMKADADTLALIRRVMDE